MSTLKKLSILSVSLLIAAGLSACEQKGPAEKAGEKIDQTVEKTGKKIDETVEETKEAIKK